MPCEQNYFGLKYTKISPEKHFDSEFQEQGKFRCSGTRNKELYTYPKSSYKVIRRNPGFAVLVEFRFLTGMYIKGKG